MSPALGARSGRGRGRAPLPEGASRGVPIRRTGRQALRQAPRQALRRAQGRLRVGGAWVGRWFGSWFDRLTTNGNNSAHHERKECGSPRAERTRLTVSGENGGGAGEGVGEGPLGSHRSTYFGRRPAQQALSDMGRSGEPTAASVTSQASDRARRPFIATVQPLTASSGSDIMRPAA